jgi:hypothetical protein
MLISSEMLWPCQFLDTAFKTDMEQAAELALAKGTAGEEVADGGQRSSVKLTRNKSSFFTCETEITPQAQASSPSLHSDYVSHFFFLFVAVSNVTSLAPFFDFIHRSLHGFCLLLIMFLSGIHLHFLSLVIFHLLHLFVSVL